MSLFPIPFLYASTFYRFRYFFSYLKKGQPQIIADVPHRICHRNKLPILIIAKNSDKFPTEIEQVEIFIDQKSVAVFSIRAKIMQDYWEHIFFTDIAAFSSGVHSIDVKIRYTANKKTYICFNDNYRGTSHKSFPCHFSDDNLPQLDGFIWGDLHCHSNYTNDQIEFGASPEATATMAKALGLSFLAITDHSYDLDDFPDNFLKNDPKLGKWNNFQNEINDLNNTEGSAIIIPGEEVSVRNYKNETVHLLVYNSPQFFPGTGDSGEQWFHFFSENSIQDIANNLPQDALAFASHPADSVPWLQNKLLNRGTWTIKDLTKQNLNGVQIINGHGLKDVYEAIQFWKKLLLKGEKTFAIAGNDAHGNFARNRSISIPFISINETYTQLFGLWRTHLFCKNQKPEITDLIIALKSGNCTLSNGPAADFYILDENERRYFMGMGTINATKGELVAASTKEFGYIKRIIIYQGNITLQKESVFIDQKFKEEIFNLKHSFEISNKYFNGYYRAVVQTEGPDGLHVAFTNPIWHNSIDTGKEQNN